MLIGKTLMDARRLPRGGCPSKAVATRRVYPRNSCQMCRQRYIISLILVYSESNLNLTAPPEKELISPVDTNASGTFMLKTLSVLLTP